MSFVAGHVPASIRPPRGRARRRLPISGSAAASGCAGFGDELASAREHLHRASIEQLPLDDSSLDGAITVNTLYFVPELDRALSELARSSPWKEPLARIGEAGIPMDPAAGSSTTASAHWQNDLDG